MFSYKNLNKAAFVNNWRRLFPVLTLTLVSCWADERSSKPICEIRSPETEPPVSITLIDDQMPYGDVIAILGEPDYSPTEGQYYYTTGGDCSLPTSGGRYALCGFVLEYRDYDRMVELDPIPPDNSRRYRAPFLPDDRSDWRLQSCSWGGIGE